MFKGFDLSSYPQNSGVYLMKDEKGVVLYVGKAKNLQKRLRQYFHGEEEKRPLIAPLLEKLISIETIVTQNEKEALLLENTLIKEHKPKYNIMLKDDKSYISIFISDHTWPKIQIVRKKGGIKGKYFGPYTNARAARSTFDMIVRLFKLRQCSDSEFAARKRPCILYDIKKCSGPCTQRCAHESYMADVKQAISFLRGEDRQILKELKEEMKSASRKEEYEKAQEILKKIKMLDHILELQGVENLPLKDSHVIGYFQKDDKVVLAILIYRGGRLIASKHFSFSWVVFPIEELLESFLLQHYTKAEVPKEIILPLSLALHSILEDILGDKLKILVPQRGAKKRVLELAEKNAQTLFQKETTTLDEKLLLQLQETLKLNRFPKKIECFDTSHTMGHEAVAALVTYINGSREKSLTRLFKLRWGGKGDLSYLREALFRHYKNEENRELFADLLIIDGGRDHLNLAISVLKELNIATIDVIALAKEEGRHDKGLRAEKIFLTNGEILLLEKDSPQLFLLQKIRDDTHMVAISYHRRRRDKVHYVSFMNNATFRKN